jgi:hypothetical protein
VTIASPSAAAVALKRRRRPRRGRSQVHAFVGDDVYQRLKALTARRGLSDCSVIETALKQYLDQSSDAALIMRRLDRAGRRIEKIGSDVEILTEFVSLWVRLWFAHTPQIADSQKTSVRLQATKRYAEFLTYVEKRLAGTHRLATDLVGEDPLPGPPGPPDQTAGDP